MTRNFRAVVPLLALSVLVACAKKEPPAEEARATPSAVAVTAPVAPAPEPAQAKVNVEAVPVEEDFEDEAQKTLTANNLGSQLDQLEKEISAPSP